MEDVWDFREDGNLYWKKTRWKKLLGKLAGCINEDGYRVLSYSGQQYKIHRLIYAYHTGRWPKLIDHIDKNRSNNKFNNLRELSVAENLANTDKITGRVPYRGVCLYKKKYRAFIQAKGVREFLGYFNTAEEASTAYETRRKQLNPGVFI